MSIVVGCFQLQREKKSPDAPRNILLLCMVRGFLFKRLITCSFRFSSSCTPECLISLTVSHLTRAWMKRNVNIKCVLFVAVYLLSSLFSFRDWWIKAHWPNSFRIPLKSSSTIHTLKKCYTKTDDRKRHI